MQRFELPLGRTTDTVQHQLSQAGLEDLLDIVRILPHTLDGVSRAKMPLQSRRCWDQQRHRLPWGNLSGQTTDATACVSAQTDAKEAKKSIKNGEQDKALPVVVEHEIEGHEHHREERQGAH